MRIPSRGLSPSHRGTSPSLESCLIGVCVLKTASMPDTNRNAKGFGFVSALWAGLGAAALWHHTGSLALGIILFSTVEALVCGLLSAAYRVRDG